MVSRRAALRKARRNFRSARRALRSVDSFDRMTVQETSENMIRNPITARGTGSELLTMSQKFTSAKPPPQCPDVNRSPSDSYNLLHFHCNRRVDETKTMRNVSASRLGCG